MYQVVDFELVAQQHNGGGGYGIETHLSYCKAEKIGDTIYYKVSPYIDGDTKDYVNILFTNKNIVLVLLNYIGRIIFNISLKRYTGRFDFYWQWTVTKSWDNLTQAAMYAMRHAWVSAALWSFIRFVVVQFLNLCIGTVESYCSCKTTYTRGKWYLKSRSNIADNVFGMPKSSFWESEGMQSLALLISIVADLISRTLLLGVSPYHHTNSFLKVIEQHRLYSGFDIPQFILSSSVVTVDNHCVVILPLSDMYIIYASINILSVVSIPSIPEPKPGNAIKFYTNENGGALQWNDSGVHIPQLFERQVQGVGMVY
ncbi:hypothetical protein THRCLA_07856, partial [Thraustotheca clavata]